MRLVNSIGELMEQARRFHALDNGSNADRSAYRQFATNGHNFFVTTKDNLLTFAPSRYVGYWGNSPRKHALNKEKHGSKTDSRIKSIIGWAPMPNPILEAAYQAFCQRIGVHNISKRERKYWSVDALSGNISADLLDLLDGQTRTSARREIDARLGQGRFREDVLNLWGRKCALTDCGYEPVLKASHIQPWAESTSKERLDPFNGIALSANADALFDRHLVSFDQGGMLLVSDSVSEGLLKQLGLAFEKRIALPERSQTYLKHHREKFEVKRKTGIR